MTNLSSILSVVFISFLLTTLSLVIYFLFSQQYLIAFRHLPPNRQTVRIFAEKATSTDAPVLAKRSFDPKNCPPRPNQFSGKRPVFFDVENPTRPNMVVFLDSAYPMNPDFFHLSVVPDPDCTELTVSPEHLRDHVYNYLASLGDVCLVGWNPANDLKAIRVPSHIPIVFMDRAIWGSNSPTVVGPSLKKVHQHLFDNAPLGPGAYEEVMAMYRIYSVFPNGLPPQ